MITVELPSMAPPVFPDTQPFWDATRQGRVLLPRCKRCAFVIWYPRSHCPECGHAHVEWFEASGWGSIYSFTVVRRGEGVYRDVPLYVLALVELQEGPRVLTNIVECNIEALRIDLPVHAVFSSTGDTAALLRFRPI